MSDVRLAVENVGGIESEEYDFDDGTTLIVGRNASNKTSLLRSVQFALGIDELPMRSGADRAGVRLEVGDRTVSREARRNGAGYEIEGDGWVTDPEDALLVRRFACLLGSNPLRGAVERGEDVESLLKEPIDVEALEAERARKLERKRELRSEIEALANVDERLEEQTAERADVRERIETLEAELDDLYAQQEETETGDERLDELREERTDLRAERGTYGDGIEELESTIERLAERRATVAEELADAESAVEAVDVERLKSERESVRAELAEITDRIDVLQSVLSANRELLDSEFAGSLGYDPGLMDDELSCWACGNAAPRGDFEDTVEELQELIAADKERKREREPQLSELERDIEAAEDAKRRVRDLEAELNDVEGRLQQRRDSLEQKREEYERVEAELERVEREIADQESERAESRSDVATDIEEVRLELQTLRREVERLGDAIDDLEADREERERKANEIEQLTEDIQALTERIENREAELRTVFNETMDELIDALGFDRIERVRLDGDFEVVIAREVDGVVREDAIDHLAESEREVIGIVLGLAGYLVYDVDEVAPILLLDSLGVFDATRTERLVEYFADRTDVLLAAIHPEVAQHLDYEAVSMS
ncbi:archaea-specific SMC-related protein [Halorientalis halophila]|uniref:archaea-specific SMC-related protein n=1 Tax=Halorientalis halophila TaxID=3108499 RepID=UPI00300A1F94